MNVSHNLHEQQTPPTEVSKQGHTFLLYKLVECQSLSNDQQQIKVTPLKHSHL